MQLDHCDHSLQSIGITGPGPIGITGPGPIGPIVANGEGYVVSELVCLHEILFKQTAFSSNAILHLLPSGIHERKRYLVPMPQDLEQVDH